MCMKALKYIYCFFHLTGRSCVLMIARNAVATETKKAHLGEKSFFFSFLFVIVYV